MNCLKCGLREALKTRIAFEIGLYEEEGVQALIIEQDGGGFRITNSKLSGSWIKRKTYECSASIDEMFPDMLTKYPAVAPESVEPRPKIVCLCGSTRFHKEFVEANYKLTMRGIIVLSVGFYPHATKEVHGNNIGVTEIQKQGLDDLHKRKIDIADEVYVLNVGGYIGKSTDGEIRYAIAHNKPVIFQEDAKAYLLGLDDVKGGEND